MQVCGEQVEGGREAGIRVLVQARRRIAASEANAKHRKTQSRLDEASQHGGERCVKQRGRGRSGERERERGVRKETDKSSDIVGTAESLVS